MSHESIVLALVRRDDNPEAVLSVRSFTSPQSTAAPSNRLVRRMCHIPLSSHTTPPSTPPTRYNNNISCVPSSHPRTLWRAYMTAIFRSARACTVWLVGGVWSGPWLTHCSSSEHKPTHAWRCSQAWFMRDMFACTHVRAASYSSPQTSRWREHVKNARSGDARGSRTSHQVTTVGPRPAVYIFVQLWCHAFATNARNLCLSTKTWRRLVGSNARWNT